MSDNVYYLSQQKRNNCRVSVSEYSHPFISMGGLGPGSPLLQAPKSVGAQVPKHIAHCRVVSISAYSRPSTPANSRLWIESNVFSVLFSIHCWLNLWMQNPQTGGPTVFL